MEKKERSAKFINQRKFFLLVPLVMFPFLTLFFWSLGGGKIDEANGRTSERNGLNTSIPDAYIKTNENPDKMAYYELAKRDSAAIKGKIASDPYSNKNISPPLTSAGSDNDQYKSPTSGLSLSHLNTSIRSSVPSQDKNERKVYEKLDQLNLALNTKTAAPKSIQEDQSKAKNTGINSKDIDRLENMMKSMGQKDGEDPELQQINSMLEKILDVQHPGRVQDKIKEISEKKRGQVFPVSASIGVNQVSLFAGENLSGNNLSFQNGIQNSAFFSLEEPMPTKINENAITAVVHDDQILVNGSTVKLRLTTDIYINGALIPKDTFVYGIANLSGDRLNVSVNSLIYQNSLYPISLSIYDIDGLQGIYIPDAISRNVAKQSADQAISGFGMNSLDPSFGAQAASAGIEAARSIISKKVRLVKVTVKSGYQILLRDSQGT